MDRTWVACKPSTTARFAVPKTDRRHLPPGRIAAKCRADYRAARAAVPAKYRKPLELILLDGQSDLVAIGKAITGAGQPPNSNRAVAIERFTAGLYMLALHYVLLA